MSISEAEIVKVMNAAMSQNKIGPAQIPDLDLYVDQIITIFEERLGKTRRRENDKILTKAMVNNYSKEKLIRPVKGKKYTREQVLQILLIFHMKNMLSIGDIKLVMGRIMEEGYEVSDLESIFKKAENTNETEMGNIIKKHLDSRYGKDLETEDVLAILMEIAELTMFLRRTAENIVDYYFAPTKEDATKSGEKRDIS